MIHQSKCRPRNYLGDYGKKYPDVWRLFDMFRADRDKGEVAWPNWCFCPLAASYAIVSGGGDNRCTLETVGDVAILGALSAWRVSQGIYRYDETLFKQLIKIQLTGIFRLMSC